MDCVEIREKLYLYLDGELEETCRLCMEEHLCRCRECSAMLAAEKDLDALVRNSFSRLEAPGALKENIAGRLEASRGPGPAAAFPAAVLAVFLVGVSLAFVLMRGAPATPLFTEAAASHAGFVSRNLRPDISSASLPEITRWLKESTGHDVLIPDLSSAGYELAGARFCLLRRMPAGCLVYERGAERLSVFIIDPSGFKLREDDKIYHGKGFFYAAAAGGLHAVLYSDEDSSAACLFVSDLPEGELVRMVKTSLGRR